MLSGIITSIQSVGQTIEEGEVNYESLHTAANLDGNYAVVKGAKSDTSSSLQISTAGVKSSGLLHATGATTLAGTLSVGGVAGSGTAVATDADTPAQAETGAVPIDSFLSTLETDGDGSHDAWTLADGVPGQLKRIILGTWGGNSMFVTPANFADGTQIAMGDANDEILLQMGPTKWRVVFNSGCTIT